MNPLSICIVAHFAYGAISGSNQGHAGGVERQTSMMARWLAQRGHRVSLLTWDEGGAREESIAGVRVIKMCRRDDGLPGLRFFHPRWTSLNAALAAADADVYFHNCAEYVTGQVASWAKRHGRHFVFSAASDPECDPALPRLRTWRERFLYRKGLHLADAIVVQTQKQFGLLQKGFGLNATVLPMPCEGPTDAQYRAPALPSQPRVLWVGRISPEKRLELLLDAAAQYPQIHFDVAGKPDQQNPYAEALFLRAASLPNVKMHGKVAWADMPKLYQQASLLCSTSLYEGFPNVFLEAWSHGVPIVSTVDPDGVIEKFKMGIASSAEDISGSISRMLQDSAFWQECSRNARRYYRETHAAEQVLPRFEEIFLRLTGRDQAIGQSA